MDIKQIKKNEIQEIYDFLGGLEEYGHIYHFPPKRLDEPFDEILNAIDKIQKLMNDSWGM